MSRPNFHEETQTVVAGELRVVTAHGFIAGNLNDQQGRAYVEVLNTAADAVELRRHLLSTFANQAVRLGATVLAADLDTAADIALWAGIFGGERLRFSERIGDHDVELPLTLEQAGAAAEALAAHVRKAGDYPVEAYPGIHTTVALRIPEPDLHADFS